jgi:hypothetical protein
MTDNNDNPANRALLERVADLERRLVKTEDCVVVLFERIEQLELQRVADQHNQKIDLLIDRYEQQDKPNA